MRLDRWLDFFKAHKDKKLFSFSDLVQLTDEDRDSLSVQLNRLVNSGTIERAVRGWYENPFNTPTIEEIAMTIRYPSYLSMEYALSRSDLLSQSVYTLTLVTTRSPYTYSYGGRGLEYHQIKKSLFFGYERRDDVSIAEGEKALLDLIYIRYVKSNEMDLEGILSLTDDMYLDEIDRESIYEYKGKYPKKVSELVERLDLG